MRSVIRYRLRGFATLAALCVVWPLATSCDHGATAPAAAASIILQPDSVTIIVGTTTSFTPTILDARGNTLTGRTVTWTSSDASKVRISQTGVASGIVAGRATITATTGGQSASATVIVQSPVASVVIQPDSASVAVGNTFTFTASPRDASGNVLTGRTITWSTSDASKVLISQSGIATGTGLGRAVITALSEGKSGTAVALAVVPTGDFGIVGATFTQGVQDAIGSVPIILQGDAAVVNVLVSANKATTFPMQIVLRLFNAAGTLIRTDTAMTNSLGPTPSYDTPSVQFLVPAATLQSGLRWQIVRDPKGLVPDDVAPNDVFPATGTAALATTTVPALTIRFVPIVLAANGNATGVVTDAQIPTYLQTLKSVQPVGQVNAHVGAAFTTFANFGTAPTGGDQAFWQQVLSELDLARISDPVEPNVNWFGILVPPPGFTSTTYGGFSYIPTSATSSAAHTRTSTGVQLNWFSKPTQARDNVAHELGHTFGRSHAPCGGAASPDPLYPVAGGTLDAVGFDVYSWANGLSSFAAKIGLSSGDVMGYCFPVWESTYSYKGVMQFRQSIISAQDVTPQLSRVLVVRGSVETGKTPTIEPAFVMNGRASQPDAAGTYYADGIAADGRLLFSYRFEPAVIDHAPNLRHFTIAIPATDDLVDALDTIVVRGPTARARVARPPRPAPRVLATPPTPTLQRLAGGSVRVSCPDATTRGILIQDAAGSALGMATGASAQGVAASGNALTILCSDGVGTTRFQVIAP